MIVKKEERAEEKKEEKIKKMRRQRPSLRPRIFTIVLLQKMFANLWV